MLSLQEDVASPPSHNYLDQKLNFTNFNKEKYLAKKNGDKR